MAGRKPLVLQSLVFKRDQWSLSGARHWLREHAHSHADPDVLVNTMRFRQRRPQDFVAGTFRTITLANGVQAVSGHLKR